MFRNLSDDERRSFRAWARDNFNPGGEINDCWHPVVQAECLLMNYQQAMTEIDAATAKREAAFVALMDYAGPKLAIDLMEETTC